MGAAAVATAAAAARHDANWHSFLQLHFFLVLLLALVDDILALVPVELLEVVVGGRVLVWVRC